MTDYDNNEGWTVGGYIVSSQSGKYVVTLYDWSVYPEEGPIEDRVTGY